MVVVVAMIALACGFSFCCAAVAAAWVAVAVAAVAAMITLAYGFSFCCAAVAGVATKLAIVAVALANSVCKKRGFLVSIEG